MKVPKDKEYEVEDILRSKKERGKEFHLIKWKNYDATHNSWEPTENLNRPLIKYLKQKKKDVAVLKKNSIPIRFECPLQNLIWSQPSRQFLDEPKAAEMDESISDEAERAVPDLEEVEANIETESNIFDEAERAVPDLGEVEANIEEESLEQAPMAPEASNFQKKRVSFKFQSSMLYFNKNESVLDLTLEKMFDT